jgi:hypothetical protein
MPDIPTYIFARVDLPAVERVAEIWWQIWTTEQGKAAPPAYVGLPEKSKEELRKTVRGIYAALEEAWEES